MPNTAKEKHQEILKVALERFQRAEEAESKNRQTFEDDVRFSNGTQWPEDIERARKHARKPMLTINKVPAFIRQVTNEARQMRPAIKVKGQAGTSDKQTAQSLNGMIRAIEQSSNAEAAYDWGVEYAVRGGFGYWRVDTDYVDGNGFQQEVQINRIRNHLSVYLDPDAEQADGSDARWGFIVEFRDTKQLEKDYPGSDKEEWSAGRSLEENWYTNNKTRIAEYWEVEKVKRTQVLLSDGNVMFEDELEQAAPQLILQGIEPVQDRQVDDCTLIHRLITARSILEETRYPKRTYIPIVRIVGEEIWEDGEILYQGMVKDMKDPQRQYNYWRTASAERGALSVKAPWIGPTGAFTDPKWKSANTENYAYLEYEPQPNGERPIREQGLDVSAAFVQEVQQSNDDLKAVTGIYDSSMGNQSNEIAGVAINARRKESDTANFHFLDNLARSMRYTGKILVEVIPQVYNDQRVMTILHEGGEEENIQLNTPFVDQKGQQRIIDLQKGRYDVAVDVGPSYATQREEAASSMLELVTAFPQAAGVMGDLIAKNMDWPDSETISDRLKMLLPPEVLQGESPQIAQMIAQKDQEIQFAQQQMQQVMGAAEQMQQQLLSKNQEHELKVAELEEKIRANDLSHAQKMTDIEGKYSQDVPGGEIYPDRATTAPFQVVP